MKKIVSLLGSTLLLGTMQFANAVELDASIKHNPNNGVIHVYGPGGPDTALKAAAKAYQAKTGTKVIITAGPESEWTKQAQKDADLIFGSSEQSMSAFVETYPFITEADVKPLYIRPAVIAVQKGNPKGIHSFKDLLDKPVKIVVTEGKGVYNTSGTGVWEDIAGRLGSIEDVKNIRSKIISFEKGSGASFKAFLKGADAWITWAHWPLTNPDKVDLVNIEPERRIYRDLPVAQTKGADKATSKFITYLTSPEAAKYFYKEGWTK
ncbi:substrate-binding domain-containing protein [Candidatus Sororendozoicomonas aggregata]|uniref:substrate-binding domain-containing protein n=1 Tax=Candidatus Sororendozoicomonas aggregata TaxID=3073239 RepID=UPI002ED499E0